MREKVLTGIKIFTISIVLLSCMAVFQFADTSIMASEYDIVTSLDGENVSENEETAEAQVKYYTITFNPNGGTVGVKKMQAKEGEWPDDEFPVAKNSSKYLSLGWYTEKTGGRLFTEEDCRGLTSDITLYARYSVPCGDNAAVKIKNPKTDGYEIQITGTGTLYEDTWYWDECYPWYYYTSEAYSLTIADGITEIPKNAFEDFAVSTEYATTLTVPISTRNLGNIPDNAEKVTLTAGTGRGCDYELKKVEEYGDVIEKVVVPWMNATSITVSSGVTYIGDYTFFDCLRPDEEWADDPVYPVLTLPSTIKEVGEHAFEYCTCKTSCALSLTKVGEYAFANSNILNKVTLDMESVPLYAFFDNTRLKTIVLSNQVKEIEEHAFGNWSVLSSVTVPASVTYIGEEAFLGNAEDSSGDLTLAGKISLQNPTCTIEEGAIDGFKTIAGYTPSTAYHYYCESDDYEDITFSSLGDYPDGYATVSFDLNSNLDDDGYDDDDDDANIFLTRKLMYGMPYGQCKEAFTGYDTYNYGSYEMIGWFTEKEGGKEIKETDLVSTKTAHTLYARYRDPSIRKVTFRFPGGTCRMPDGSLIEDEAVWTYQGRVNYGSLPVPKVRAGYTFRGWKDPLSDELVNRSTPFREESEYELVAVWAKICKISLYLKPGDSSTIRTWDGDSDKSYGKFPSYLRSGYRFLGWTKKENVEKQNKYEQNPSEYYALLNDPEGLAEFQSGFVKETDCPTTDEDLVGIWIPEPVTVTLYAILDDATPVQIKTDTGYYNMPYTLPNNMERSHYKFKGWYQDKKATISAERTTTITAPVSFYALYQYSATKINFHFSGAYCADRNKKNWKDDYSESYDGDRYDFLPFPGNKGDYVFRGWSLSENGTKPYVKIGDFLSKKEEYDLYAVWAEQIEIKAYSSVKNGFYYGSLFRYTDEPYGEIDKFYDSQYIIAGCVFMKDAEYFAYYEENPQAYYDMVEENGEEYEQFKSKLIQPTSMVDKFNRTIAQVRIPKKYEVKYYFPQMPENTYFLHSSKDFFYDQLITFPTPQKIDGYMFEGWYADPSWTWKYTDNTTCNHDSSCYARYIVAPKVSVTFRFAGGVITDEDGKKHEDSYSCLYNLPNYGSLPIPMKTGYRFDGWRDKKTGEIVTADSVLKADETYELEAEWSLKACKISFHSMPGDESVRMTGTSYAFTPYGELPSMGGIGYRFLGWAREADVKKQNIYAQNPAEYYELQKDSNALQKFNEGFVKKTDFSVDDEDFYGIWVANEVLANFYIVGVEDTPTFWKTDTAYYDNIVPFPEDFEEYGIDSKYYEFEGWSTDAEGKNKVTKTEKISAENEVSYYAQFKPKGKKVTFHFNGFSCRNRKDIEFQDSMSEYYIDDSYDYLPVPKEERDGYVFRGWSLSESGNQPVVKVTDALFDQDEYDLYDVWAKELEIKFYTSAKNQSLHSTIKRYSDETYGTLAKIELSNNIGAGWTLLKNADYFTYYENTPQAYYDMVEENGEEYERFKSMLVTSNTPVDSTCLSLVHVWIPLKYEISYCCPIEPDMEEYYVRESDKIFYHYPITFPEPWEIEDYTFEGWYDSPDGTKEYKDGILCNGNTSFYAHYKEMPKRTVIFQLNGGTMDYEQKEYTDGLKFRILPTPENESGDFLGWYSSPDFEEDSLVTEESVVNRDTEILYARWKLYYAIPLSTCKIECPQKDYFASGSSVMPDLKITYEYKAGKKRKVRKLIRNVDYSLAYESNLHSNDSKSKIIVKGIGDFCGTKIVPFSISKGSLEKATVKAPRQIVYSDDFDAVLKDSIQVYLGTYKIPSEQYQFSYEKSRLGERTKEVKVRILAQEDGDFTGACKKPISIIVLPKSDNAINAKELELHWANNEELITKYNGKLQTPVPVVTYKGVKVPLKDYYLQYENNLHAGVGTVYVQGVGEFAGKSDPLYFKIVPKDVTKLTVLKIGNLNFRRSVADILPVVMDGKTVLEEGKDYQLIFDDENDLNLGNKKSKQIIYTVKALNGSDYTGQKTFRVTIVPRSIAKSYMTEIVCPDAVLVNGKAIPKVTVTYNGLLLTEGVDYKVSFKGNTKPGKKANATIQGIGNYTGKRTVKFMVKE